MPPQRRSATDRFLAIYINDHRAASAGGLALARRCARASVAGPVGDVLEEIANDIAEDRATLEQVARMLGVRTNPVKAGMARFAELVGRLKLNGRWRGTSPLSRLIEREGLLAGIDAKRSLWLSLHTAHRRELALVDFEHLAQRATDQRDRLASLHRLAATEALRDEPAAH